MADKVSEKYEAPGGVVAPATEATVAAAESPPGKGRHRCPTCNGELIDHGYDNAYKAGAHHCNTCGSCWASGMRELREGHPGPKAPEPVAG